MRYARAAETTPHDTTSADVIGRTVSHYRIVGQLGAGGMGVVYAAEDYRLGRPVALKFVPEDLAKDQHAIERLRSEARTASGLNHANICTIYDIDEYEGRPFIAMELLKGQTLRDRLNSGPLKIHNVVELGIQVADALDSAHRRDIIHRDLKPANLFLVERGQTKILDFGLAKLVSPQPAVGTTEAQTRDQTAEGIALGTVAYMSPEQVTGEQLDGRTDLFSLGVVLYECLTGRQPFTGKTSAVIFSAILTRAPVAPAVFNPEMPPRLQEVINNCLEKDRELRYQDAAGLRADLKRIKRDLESGRSGVFRIAGSAPLGSGDLSSDGRSSLAGVSRTDTAPPEQLDQPTGRSGRRGVTFTAVATVLIIGVALAIIASFLMWARARAPLDTTAAASSQAFVRSRLALATTSLDAKDYRGALAYADEVLRAEPDERDAIRIRGAARAMVKRFDDSIARAGDLLAAGDTDSAATALNTARTIDPAAPVVGELSARLVSQLKTQAEAARRDGQHSRSTPSPMTVPHPQDANEPPRLDVQRQRSADEPGRMSSPLPQGTRAPVDGALAESPTAQAVNRAPTNPPTAAAPAPAPRPAPPTEPVPQAIQPVPPPANSTPERRDATAAPSRTVETDEAGIRRVVATYARAIETKDVALFRTVKPNLSSDEQRRIEEGFRAVASQQVTIDILSIEQHGQDASVRLRRRDTIQAGGRQQTTESQQTMTLTRSGSGWVIREIGR
jgi:serine/threonine protein kinase